MSLSSQRLGESTTAMAAQEQPQFDLNLANYSLKDVESFFQLEPGSTYTAAQVDLREAEIRQLLLSSGHIHKRFQRDLIHFLDEAKQWLIRHAQSKTDAGKTAAAAYPGTTITTLTNLPQMDPFPNLPHDPAASAMRERGDNLLRHQAMPYVGTLPSDVFASDNGLNPLKVRTMTRCVNIDTRFRHMPMMTETADMTIHLPFKLEKVVSMQLASIEFPLVLPGVSQAYGNNYFWVATAPDVAHQYEIRIPDGDYGAQELLDVIHQEVSAVAMAEATADPILSSLEFVLDPKTGRVMVHSLTGEGFALDFVRRSAEVVVGNQFGTDGVGGGGMMSNTMEEMMSTRLGYNLGMMRGLYGNAKEVGTYRSEWVGETRMDPTCPLRYVYVAVEDFQQNVSNHFVSAFETSVLAPDIFVRLSVKGSTQTTWSEGGMRQLCETNHGMISEPRRYFGPVNITRLRVRVLDDHGRLLRLGMTNYSLSLVFKMIYDL